MGGDDPMTMVVRGISIGPEIITLEYIDASHDMRANGLSQNHVLFVPRDEDYDQEIEALEEAATALLKDALEDFALMEPMDPEVELAKEMERAAEKAADEDEPTVEFP